MKPDAESRAEHPHSAAFSFTTRRPVAILMSFLAVGVFGGVSYGLLPLNLMPDLTYPSVTVRTEYAGNAPEEVETAISRPIEQELGVVADLVRISSVSRAGLSDVILDFAWGTSMSDATQEVREKLDQVFLPDDAARPLILRYDPQLDPVIRLGLHGGRDLYFLREYGEEELRRDLESLPGIAAVKVKGGLEEEIRVELDERRLATYRLSIVDVGQRLAAANVNLAGGNLEEGQTEYVVRTLNEFQTLEQIGDIAVADREGAVVRIKDVGTVYRDHVERDVITRVNGEESVEIDVFKEADANIVEVAKLVRERIFGTPQQQAFVAQTPVADSQATPEQADRLRRQMSNFLSRQLPPGVSLTLLSDQSTFIENALDEVRSTALWGGVLAVVVLYLFLRQLVPTVIVAVAIPVSIVATFAPMYWFGVSLNIMSLGGLALGIGMLVDNSVVVLESITRCREEGDELLAAVVRGTGEVGTAVVAATLTTVAVFAPIVFVEGVAGQVFADLSLTVVFSLLTSLVVALFLVPMLASRSIPTAGEELSGSGETAQESAAAQPMTRLQRLAQTPLGRVPALVARALIAAIVVTVKGVGLLAALVTAPLWLWRWPWASLASHGHGSTLFGYDPAATVWPELLQFRAPELLGTTLQQLFLRRPASGRLVTIWRWLIRLLATGYLVIVRTPLQILLATLGKLLLAVAIVVVTLAGAIIGAIVATLVTVASPALRAFDIGLGGVRRVYPVLLRTVLRQPAVSAGTLLVATASVLYVLGPRLGMELIPEVRQGVFDVQARLPVGTPLEITDATLAPLERLVRGEAGVEAVATSIGVDREEFDPDPEAGEHSGRFTVRLDRSGEPIDEDAVIARIRDQLGNLPNVVTKISRPAMFSTKTPIEVEVRADDLDTLRRVSEILAERLARLPELTDVKSTLQRGHPEIQIHYNRERLSRYGLDIAQVAALVRNKVQGDVASRFRRGDRRVDIRVRVRPQDRATIDDLHQLVINPGQQNPIRLDSVADLLLAEGPSEVRRIDQRRAAVISANTNADLATATATIATSLSSFEEPGVYTFAITGQREEMERSTRSLAFALSLAVFLVYVVMASQFESLVHPFVILFSIPLAAVGVAIALWALQIPLSVVVLLGCIMLAGIVVNNAIVLVDYINHLRRTGLDKIDAIVEAGSIRLRPILMTTFTTVIGLMPMALGLGDGAEIRTPMAITVIAGLLTSTLLTLFVVPVVYAVLDRKN